MERRRWGRLLGLVAVAALTAAGCADKGEKNVKTIPAAADSGSYVGKVEGTTANIGLVIKDDKLAGFVCQDENTSLRLDPVPVENGAAELVHDGKVVGSVAITDHGATGKVAFAGTQRIFAAEEATGKAGVYRLAAMKAGDAWDGWVVLNDGTYTGTKKASPTTGKPWISPDTDP